MWRWVRRLVWGERRRWLGPEDREKLLVRFAVDPETPLLVGVLLVARGERERWMGMGMGGRVGDSARAWACGGVAAMEEFEGLLVEMVEEARRRENEGKEKAG
jgi:hypothetical protein